MCFAGDTGTRIEVTTLALSNVELCLSKRGFPNIQSDQPQLRRTERCQNFHHSAQILQEIWSIELSQL